jgi:PAS domain S-box-containing protein
MAALDKQDRQQFLEELFQVTGDAFIVTDDTGVIIMINKAACALLGYAAEEIKGEHFTVLSPVKLPRDAHTPLMDALFKDGFIENHETFYTKKDGTLIPVEANVGLLADTQGNIKGAVAAVRDLTKRKNAELCLKKKEQELEINNIRLKEINTALRVLLQERDEDKKNLEENIAANLKKLVLPHFDKMKIECGGCKQKLYIDIIESNVMDIVSPFIQTLSKKNYKLSSREISVAAHVKAGRTTKEIAHCMHISVRTVEVYRSKIRKKLSLQNKKVNLQVYLDSLS